MLAEISGNMAVMLRPKLSAKIAFAILGKPSNMASKPSSLQRRIRQAMQSQDTRLVR